MHKSGDLAVFAVFAVFPANYQLPASRFSQKPWRGSDIITAKPPLFRRYFPSFFRTLATNPRVCNNTTKDFLCQFGNTILARTRK